MCSVPCVGFPRPVGAGRPEGKTERDEWRLWRGGAPLTIPNREVKPRRDDDTARKRGKVVRRPPIREACIITVQAFLIYIREARQQSAGGLICFLEIPYEEKALCELYDATEFDAQGL